jgi:hypothetical protein
MSQPSVSQAGPIREARLETLLEDLELYRRIWLPGEIFELQTGCIFNFERKHSISSITQTSALSILH